MLRLKLFCNYHKALALRGVVCLSAINEGVLTCTLTLSRVRELDGLVDIIGELDDYPTHNLIWFEQEEFYTGSMPFEIRLLGVDRDGVIWVVVKGQESDRIRRKWTDRFSDILKLPVVMRWLQGG